MSHKICIYCKEKKTIGSFPKHSLYKDNLDTRCRDCVKSQAKIRKELHKTAPPKPDVCECCGNKPLKWCLDHDHKTNKFRGWICDRCNTGLGKLGDNIEGLEKAKEYLLKAEKNNLDSNEQSDKLLVRNTQFGESNVLQI